MIKYKDYYVVFEEIPEETSLAINITNCQNKCEGCHSPELRCDIGDELTEEVIDDIISKNYGITCFLFMGEGNDRIRLFELANYVREKHKLKVGLYSGREIVEPIVFFTFDYVKVGPYIPIYGPLNSKTTNQRLFKVTLSEDRKSNEIVDITEKFWKDKI